MTTRIVITKHHNNNNCKYCVYIYIYVPTKQIEHEHATKVGSNYVSIFFGALLSVLELVALIWGPNGSKIQKTMAVSKGFQWFPTMFPFWVMVPLWNSLSPLSDLEFWLTAVSGVCHFSQWTTTCRPARTLGCMEWKWKNKTPRYLHAWEQTNLAAAMVSPFARLGDLEAT